ncbi:sulfite exporter TauE/SafE family protein [Alicyclobacillus sp. SO9]|uniref:sulfite exporter TauE/SafE family protein n=1 Tax=Alicyclobacillus sp. SO9 TaxID=2665646 RepID=UPI0018E7B349|nr:sulfite exporter TauE/SafE family protein [Alicyclobacillus sp. SO9]QQE77119.1 sulfite exporter TauE/SafE family protein [Alicyclobacillus sp. SO9]
MDYSIAGFAVGVLVGVSGIGGALVMTPLLILWFHMTPEMAVGTDLAYAFVTKAVGSFQHMRQKTVDFFAVRWLSYGSIPGAVLGSVTMSALKYFTSVQEVNRIVSHALGAVYIATTAILVFQWFIRRRTTIRPMTRFLKPILVALGVFTGVIVGVTSVGSGSLYLAVLAVVYPISAAKLVGTDLVQSVLMTGIAAIAHWAVGAVNPITLLYLLIGSIPGIMIGSRLTLRVPAAVIRIMLLALLGWSSVNMLSAW